MEGWFGEGADQVPTVSALDRSLNFFQDRFVPFAWGLRSIKSMVFVIITY